MEKTTLSEIKSDIKYKRDSLHLAHEDLKRQSDYYNKFIIFISLASTLFESAKMKLNWNNQSLELFPIFLSSIVAAISALIKFKRYNEQQEVLIQSCTVLTSTLSKARNSTEVDETLLREYHEALELLETSLYPDVRKRFLRASQNNLVSIIANEDTYFNLIEKAKSGQNIKRFQSDVERGPGEMTQMSGNIDNTGQEVVLESPNNEIITNEETPVKEKDLQQVQEITTEKSDSTEKEVIKIETKPSQPVNTEDNQ